MDSWPNSASARCAVLSNALEKEVDPVMEDLPTMKAEKPPTLMEAIGIKQTRSLNWPEAMLLLGGFMALLAFFGFCLWLAWG